MLTRRTIAFAVPALALASCAGVALTPAQIVADAGTLANGLSGALNGLVAAYPALIPAATAATLQSDLLLAASAASSLSASVPATTGASTAQTIDGYINAVLNTLAAPPINGLIPTPFNSVIAAAAIVVPEIEAFVNQYLPTAAAVAPGVYAARAKLTGAALTVSTVPQALLILQGYVGK